MRTSDITIKPILTERSMKDANLSWFTFSVNLQARKPEIKKVVERSFSVNVVDLKTNIVKNKSHGVPRTRRKIVLSPWKKVRVKLISGQKIPIFEGLEDGKKA